VEWEKTEHDHKPKTARIACEACGALWSEGERLRALASVRWHQTRPFTCCGRRQVPLEAYETAWKLRSGHPVETVWQWWASERHAVYRATCAECGRLAVDNEHAGFHASKLYSPWAKDRPADIARKWLASKDDEDKKQAFWNTQLGLPYRRNAGKEVAAEALAAHGEIWDAEVPAGVGLITVGVDVQDYRVELEVVGWGANEESWSLAYHIIEGEFSDLKLQALLDMWLVRRFKRADGRPFEVAAACIDSGGHHTQDVYTFCKARIGRRVWAIKGDAARSGKRSPVWPTSRPSQRNKRSYRPVIIGVNAAKDTIASRLGKEQVGAGFMHFPADRDLGYFAQLTAERSVMMVRGGQRFRVWELRRGRANEALDCRVYAYAALCGLMHFGVQLNKRTAEVAKPVPLDISAAPNVTPLPGVPVQAGPTVQREEPRKKSLANQLA
jgi:phage terminase large subunit GpA-like protein